MENNQKQPLDEFAVRKMISEALKKGRLKKKLTLKQVKEKCGLSISMVSQIESGKVMPSVMTICKLQTVYNKNYFFGIKHVYPTQNVMNENESLANKFDKIKRILLD